MLPLERAQEMIPTERQEFALRLMESMGKTVGGDGNSHEPPGAVFNTCDETCIDNGDILLEEIINLTVGKTRKTEKRGISLIEQLKNTLAISTFEQVAS